MEVIFSLEGSIIMAAIATAIAILMYFKEDDVADFLISILKKK